MCPCLPNAAIDLGRMMAGRLAKEPGAVLDRPHLLVAGAKIEPSESCQRNCTRAHRTGLQRHIEIMTGKPFRAQQPCGLSDRQHFRMAGRVLEFQCAVTSPGNDAATSIGQHGTHRNFAAGGRSFRLLEGSLHWLWQFHLHSAT